MRSDDGPAPTAAAGPSDDARGAWRRRLLSIGVAAGLFGASLDSTVNVALPSLAAAFRSDQAGLQWIIIAFVTTNMALSIGAGSAGDRFGQERLFRWGLVLYAAAMLLIALAPDLRALVAFRVVQGVAAAVVLAAGPALAASTFPAAVRGRVLGVTAGMQAAGSVASGFGGGLLIDLLGWQAIFVGRVPFLLGAALLVWMIPRTRSAAATADATIRFDVTGALTLALALASLVIGVNLAARDATSFLAPALMALAIVMAIVFVRWERRAAAPMLDVTVLRRRPVRVALGTVFLSSLGMFTIWFIFPFFVSDVLGRGPRTLGALFGIQGTAMAAAGPLGGWLTDRLPPARVLTLAGLAVVTGLALIARLGPDSGLWAATIPLILAGAGQGALVPASWTLALGAFPAGRSGTAFGALNLGRSLGVVLSVALFSAILALREAAHRAAVGDEAVAHLAAFRETFALAALVAAAGVGCSLLAWRSEEQVDTP